MSPAKMDTKQKRTINDTILTSSLTLTCLSLIKSTLSKSCHFRLRDIHQIHHLLPLSAVTALANSLGTNMRALSYYIIDVYYILFNKFLNE